MKEYMLLYVGGDPDWHKTTPPDEIKALMAKWGAWFASLSEKGRLTTGGSPLQGTGRRLTKDGVVTDISASEVKELVTGYSIVKAEDYDDAVAIARDCPMFARGNARIEVREIYPM